MLTTDQCHAGRLIAAYSELRYAYLRLCNINHAHTTEVAAARAAYRQAIHNWLLVTRQIGADHAEPTRRGKGDPR